jgi:hypothetical protein
MCVLNTQLISPSKLKLQWQKLLKIEYQEFTPISFKKIRFHFVESSSKKIQYSITPISQVYTI